jgi:hypothetical protein
MGPKFKFAKHGKCGAELIGVVAASRHGRGRHRHREVHAHGRVQSRARPAPHEHRLATVRPTQHGRVVQLRPGHGVAGLAGVRRVQHRQERSERGRGQLGPGFLPSVHQGTMFRSVGDPVLYLSNPPGVDETIQRATLDSIKRLNQQHLDVVGDPEIATRINQFELASRMQTAAPELMDISKEPKEVLEMYGAEPGKGSFANACLLARRMAEKGVRFIEIFHEAGISTAISRKTSCRIARTPIKPPRAHQGPQATRHVGRHARRLGRRIRAHADGRRTPRATTVAIIIRIVSRCGSRAAA